MSRTALFSRKQAGGVFTISDFVDHPGSIFFVHSGTGTNSVSAGVNPDAPLATLDYAIGLCTASKGDVIYVMPGHAESYGTGAGFAADVAGVKIVGLGEGATRPTFTFAHALAACTIGASSVTIENIRFVAGITAVAAALTITAAFTDTTIRNCEFYYGGTTAWDFVLSIVNNAACNRTTIENCKFLAEEGTAGAASAVKLVGASEYVTVKNCTFLGDYSVACLNGITVLSNGLLFLDNVVHNLDAGEPYLEVLTGTTGVIANTRGLASGATIAANAVADAMAHC